MVIGGVTQQSRQNWSELPSHHLVLGCWKLLPAQRASFPLPTKSAQVGTAKALKESHCLNVIATAVNCCHQTLSVLGRAIGDKNTVCCSIFKCIPIMDSHTHRYKICMYIYNYVYIYVHIYKIYIWLYTIYICPITISYWARRNAWGVHGVLFLLHGQLQPQELLVSTLLSHEFLGEWRGTGK